MKKVQTQIGYTCSVIGITMLLFDILTMVKHGFSLATTIGYNIGLTAILALFFILVGLEFVKQSRLIELSSNQNSKEIANKLRTILYGIFITSVFIMLAVVAFLVLTNTNKVLFIIILLIDAVTFADAIKIYNTIQKLIKKE
ncbi:hypothetical protein AAA439_13005 [Lactobacillus crispatus]|uniref:Uncharacterized protein n=1 Tax=Lactobacillus crispatus FB077-07 TaxID=883092 RepID=K1N1L1_9LACO|nr:hypothetical protein [Lactobacillus crispatus]EKB62214.1 hypothetical protein HMPREF9249_02437 [Lactobacillus crispatus FB077-07]TDN01410.1 hypothetical protein CEE85_12200 [Lactobacillus crispatus]CPR62652.1 Uncharacterised protein [Chlamydia trachomatis]